MINSMYDIAVIGMGPAGATLARLLRPGVSVIALDRKRGSPEGGFQKPCGGLLAPDAQKALARFGLTLPLRVMVDPQIFSVRTIDAPAGLVRHYQRLYLNLDRHAFDHWLLSLLPSRVELHRGASCVSLERIPGGFRFSWREGAAEHHAAARYVVGADGAASFVRRSLCPAFRMRRYTAIQQWYADTHPTPFYSCIFDPGVTDCYAWGLSKNGRFIFGGAFEPHGARERFETLKRRMRSFGFQLDAPVKTEACAVLRPENPFDMHCGTDGCFLLGEAAGFISPSSLEGLSYAFDSARILSRILNARARRPNREYFAATLGLRAKLTGKLFKCPPIFHPRLRRLIMRSGLGSIALEDGP